MFKKILIYGENWVGTLPQLLASDLSRRGFTVENFDFTEILPGIRNRSLKERVQRRLFEKLYIARIRSLFLKKIEKFSPDLVLVAKGLHVDKATLISIKSKGIRLVNWNPDDFFNLKNSNLNLIEAMSEYDLIVSSRIHIFQKYRDHGANNLLYLDWYYVPELHFDRGCKKNIKASFVGSWSPFREEFIGQLTTPFRIWGGGWEKSSKAFQRIHSVQNKILSQAEMSIVFTSSKFNLNLLTHENNDLSNLRFFEVPASGGLLLTERNLVAEKYLSDFKECLMFSSSDEVNKIIGSNLNFDKIANAGKNRITSTGNAFSSRVDELLEKLI